MAIEVEGLRYVYRDGARTVVALDGVSFRFEPGTFVALAGVTGSGKSTLLEHLNGLRRPAAGTVRVDGVDLFAPQTDRRRIRQRVGLLFQSPEAQLFAPTVADDIAFGPRNLGLPPEEVRSRVEEGMAAVGLDPSYASRSPFELSGGEQRRVAIAGVLALRPRYLILDEPTAGLDPAGRNRILIALERLRRRQGVGILFVTHRMEEVARWASRLLVLSGGRLVADGVPARVFASPAFQAAGLEPPFAVRLLSRLQEAGFAVPSDRIRPAQAARAIAAAFRPEGEER